MHEIIRLPLWADIDAFPGLVEAGSTQDAAGQEQSDDVFAYPVSRVKEVAPFLLSGMVYGWQFTYTPSDKMRNVSEYFECTEIHPFTDEKKDIRYVKPWIEDSRLYCWAEYTRSGPMVRYYEQWLAINHPQIHGAGYGKISDGFDGIKTASTEALHDAVRTYYRKIIKNKPKEITGTVLIESVPRLAVDAGRYVVELDFFLETGTIVNYTVF